MWARLRFVFIVLYLPNSLLRCPLISLSTSSGEGLVLVVRDVAECWSASIDFIPSSLVGSEGLDVRVWMTLLVIFDLVVG